MPCMRAVGRLIASARRCTPVALVTSLAVLALISPAAAFDTGPHSDMTADALAAEGFAQTPINVMQVDNWLVDLYENGEDLSHSGHGGVLVTLLGGGYGDRENWSQEVMKAADRSHFDATTNLLNNAFEVNLQWERLRGNTAAELRAARDRRDPLAALTVLGISLHQVQDFYTHTSWLEPVIDRPYGGGPGWAQKGYGSTPTWFDVPAALRVGPIYTGGASGVPRNHGSWKQDGNQSLATGNAKDWPGRPLYTEAYTAAYFASRQWVQAVRGWIADEGFWSRIQTYADRGGGALDHDLRGALRISLYSGHWQGQGEACRPSFSTSICGARSGPGGSLEDLRFATNDYFEDRGKTIFRTQFERYVVKLATIVPPVSPSPLYVPSSQEMQRQTTFARLRVTGVHEEDDRDFGPIDEADFYVKATLGGQAFRSGTIFGEDHFTFGRPNAPFTFLRSVPSGSMRDEPLRSLLVEVRTGSASGSGTDDDIYLRINPTTRFPLDKRLYDDFERGDRDTYSLPIDDLVRNGATLREIQQVQVEKSSDGRFGAWKLGGVKVIANDRLIYSNDRIETWVEKNRRTWIAPGFVPPAIVTRGVGITMALWDDDAVLTGADDHTDINPLVRRKDAAFVFDPAGPFIAGTAKGGSRHGGRLGDGDVARLTYQLDAVAPQPAAATSQIGSDLPPPATVTGPGAVLPPQVIGVVGPTKNPSASWVLVGPASPGRGTGAVSVKGR